MNDTGMIILAAGNSSRLGRPKQSLIFRGKTLLQHICDQAVLAGLKPIIVTGAHEKEVCGSVVSKQATLIQNPDWHEGMGTGIRTGLAKLGQQMPRAKNTILTVCDQPYVTAHLFQELILKTNQSKCGIVASLYARQKGTPVLFDHRYFEELKTLKNGAKEMLDKYEDDLVTVSFDKGHIDIDTEEDYNLLLNHGLEFTRP